MSDDEIPIEPPRPERRLTAQEAVFLKDFAANAVAGRHVLCLVAHALVALGKVVLALSVLGAAIATMRGWRHQ